MHRFAIRSGALSFALGSGRYRIGRGDECEVRVADETVSSLHATLVVDEGALSLEEHGPRNCVRVNGVARRGTVELSSGDRISVGAQELVIEDREAAAASFAEEGERASTRPLPRVRSDRAPLTVLSGRERDVLERIARGQGQRDIAEELGVSVKTVETYRSRLLEKLGVATRAELVALAIQSGLLRGRRSAAPPRPSRPPPAAASRASAPPPGWTDDDEPPELAS